MRAPSIMIVALLIAATGCATETPVVLPPVVHADRPAPAPDRYAALVRDAHRHMLARELPAALTAANEALRVVPFGIGAGVIKVEAHLALGQRVEAVDFAERLRDQNAGAVEAHYAYAKALYALGRIYAAYDAFADCLARDQTNRLCRVGLLTTMAHDPNAPLDEMLARAADLQTEGPDADALNALGMAAELRGDVAEAESFYARAVTIRDVHPWAHYNLALLMHARADMPAARPHFEAFLAQAPPSAVREIEEVKKLLQEKRR